MQIMNYEGDFNDGSIVCKFSIYFPENGKKYNHMKLLKGKKGGSFVVFPSFGIPQDDGTKKYIPAVELSEIHAKDFQKQVKELLKDFISPGNSDLL